MEMFLTPVEEISSFAGNGKWDYLGKSLWLTQHNFDYVYIDPVYYSTGGDYMIRIPPFTIESINPKHTGAATEIKLYEEDPGADDFVTSWFLNGAPVLGYDYVVRDINKFVDGTNKKAEFYTTHQTNYFTKSAVYAEYYD